MFIKKRIADQFQFVEQMRAEDFPPLLRHLKIRVRTLGFKSLIKKIRQHDCAHRLILELVTGVEPATCGLRYRCSAIEPHQHYSYIILPKAGFVNRKNEIIN